VLALGGVYLARPNWLRVFLASVTAIPIAGLAVLGPASVRAGEGIPGYWGAAVVPLALALCGAGFAWTSALRPAEPVPGGKGTSHRRR
jgi:hypothetical protein